jgi:hypothetical protein
LKTNQNPDLLKSQSSRGITSKITSKMTNETGKKIHEAFKELLKVADARKQTFLVGVIENINNEGAQMRPLLNFRQFVSRFFEGIRYEEGKLGTAQSTGLPLGRVMVHMDDVHTMKLRVRDGWRNSRDLGWWVGQETPVDLRQMETNAFRFIMETKSMCDELRRFYLEVDDGFVRFQGAPFLPVYMIPVDKELWPELAGVLLKMVLSVKSASWVDRFRRDLRKLDPGLLEEWNDIFKLTGEEERSPRTESDGESIRLLGKLHGLGRRGGLSRGVSASTGLFKTPATDVTSSPKSSDLGGAGLTRPGPSNNAAGSSTSSTSGLGDADGNDEAGSSTPSSGGLSGAAVNEATSSTVKPSAVLVDDKADKTMSEAVSQDEEQLMDVEEASFGEAQYVPENTGDKADDRDGIGDVRF